MRILQLFADWKWTGPAELYLSLCDGLKKKGIDVFTGFKKPPKSANISISLQAVNRGIKSDLNLGFFPADIFLIKKFVKSKSIDLVHTHLPTDHKLAYYAKRLSKFTLVRTNYSSDIQKPSSVFRNTDCYIRFSKKLLSSEQNGLGIPSDRCFVINPGMDLDRIPNGQTNFIKEKFGIPKDSLVIGIVMRVQKERQFDMILQGVKLLSSLVGNFRVLVMGRGTRIKELAIDPAKYLGISDRFIFAGYIVDDYISTLNSIDVMIYPRPGSDGTCRALREAMLLGKPAIGTNFGMIPEIISKEQTGFLADSAEELAAALLKLYKDKDLRIKMGVNSMTKAKNDYSMDHFITNMINIYNTL